MNAVFQATALPRSGRRRRRRLGIPAGLLVGIGLMLLGLVAGPPPAWAAAPEGHADAIGPTLIGGWARDPDYPGPIPVHIYIDGKLAHAMSAAALRPDLPYADQDHGYTWIPPVLGAGTHPVIVYAIGVNAAGVPDGQNVALSGSPANIADGCNGLTEPALTWCQGVPNYYVHRAADTAYLYNDQLRVGVNGSYGGTILELYAADHAFNLLAEHGGGAVQLSIWGYDPVGPDAWFAQGDGVCDPQPYATEAACLGAGHTSCRIWCCSQGAHVPDCTTVRSCVGWGAGAPFNPIQAQAADCGWDSPTNDVDQLQTGTGTVYISKTGPYHFTETDAMAGLTWEETATLHMAYVELDYRITYSGPYSLTTHPQEIPAVFPAWGMNHTYFYYDGSNPWADPSSAVTTATTPANGLMLRLANRAPYPHSNVDAVLTEPWVTACNAARDHCLTVAMLSPQYKEVNAAAYPGNGYGYLTPLGGFAITPGMDEQFTAYLFPYRHDQVVAGRTVRQWIYDLAAGAGCQAEGYPCDDSDPCTVADRCQAGSCVGDPDPACATADAGVSDAAVAADAGPLSDAETGADGALPLDGGSGTDSGASPDGNPGTDGTVGADSTVSGDSGSGSGPGTTGGCACDQAGGGPGSGPGRIPWPEVLFGLALGLGWLRRRASR